MDYSLYIDGKWCQAKDGKTVPVTNPANGQVIGSAADATAEDVVSAIEAAHKAFPLWAAKSARERSEILYKAYQLMLERIDEIARVLTMEQGKPLAEAKGEVLYAADYIQWYAEEAKRVYGDVIPATYTNKRIFVFRQPIGVIAAITPWNFPAAMIARKIAPALAVGCTAIVKPAEQTPLTAGKLVEVFHDAGLPAGALNLVTGSKPSMIGQTLLADSRVRKVTFTGSTPVGKLIMKQAADTVKRVSLELGGHAPFIVFPDADLELAASQVIASKYRNAGQTCICTNRIYVHEDVVDDFTEKFVVKVKELKIGDGLEEGVQIGPLIDEEAIKKVDRHVQDAISKGAQLATGGRQLGGLYYEPTVLCGVTDDMLIQQEETFGPVAPIQIFKDEKEVIQKANNTPYGLASYLFTQDIARAFRVAEALEYGIVGINDGAPSTAQAPFGGVKESGMGREGGKHGLEDYLEIKYISLGGVDKK